ncbi:hypothetical protein ACWD4J_02700 [Streptomyces sp. NPDC002577]
MTTPGIPLVPASPVLPPMPRRGLRLLAGVFRPFHDGEASDDALSDLTDALPENDDENEGEDTVRPTEDFEEEDDDAASLRETLRGYFE